MVDGLKDWERRLARIPEKVKAAAEVAIGVGANEIAASQRMLAPVEEGDLKQSVRVEDGKERLQKTVTAGGPLTTRPVREGVSVMYDYSIGIEYGTSDMPAKPFFWSGYRLVKKRVVNRVKRAMSKAARES